MNNNFSHKIIVGYNSYIAIVVKNNILAFYDSKGHLYGDSPTSRVWSEAQTHPVNKFNLLFDIMNKWHGKETSAIPKEDISFLKSLKREDDLNPSHSKDIKTIEDSQELRLKSEKEVAMLKM